MSSLLASHATLRRSRCAAREKIGASRSPWCAAYTYRAGETSDGPTIRELIISTRMNPLGLDPTRFRVACDEDGSIVGFGQLKAHTDAIAELRSLFVREEHRKAGVGSQLVADLLTERGSREVWLLTPKYRANFYERCGFDVVPPWELPKFMLVDVVLGQIVLAVVAQASIIGMVYRPKDAS